MIADARLTAKQRRRFVTVADLFREADVLVVARDHPACAGITQAQALAIVRGGIKRWSEVVQGAAADAGSACASLQQRAAPTAPSRASA